MSMAAYSWIQQTPLYWPLISFPQRVTNVKDHSGLKCSFLLTFFNYFCCTWPVFKYCSVSVFFDCWISIVALWLDTFHRRGDPPDQRVLVLGHNPAVGCDWLAANNVHLPCGRLQREMCTLLRLVLLWSDQRQYHEYWWVRLLHDCTKSILKNLGVMPMDCYCFILQNLPF